MEQQQQQQQCYTIGMSLSACNTTYARLCALIRKHRDVCDDDEVKTGAYDGASLALNFGLFFYFMCRAVTGNIVVTLCVVYMLRRVVYPGLLDTLEWCAHASDVVTRAVYARFGEAMHIMEAPEGEKPAVRAAREKQWDALQKRITTAAAGDKHICLDALVDRHEPLMPHNEQLLSAHGYRLYMQHCNVGAACLLQINGYDATRKQTWTGAAYILARCTREYLVAHKIYVLPRWVLTALCLSCLAVPSCGALMIAATFSLVVATFMLGMLTALSMALGSMFFMALAHNSLQYARGAAALLSIALEQYSPPLPPVVEEEEKTATAPTKTTTCDCGSGCEAIMDNRPIDETRADQEVERTVRTNNQWARLDRVMLDSEGRQHIPLFDTVMRSEPLLFTQNCDALQRRGYRLQLAHCGQDSHCLIMDHQAA